LLLIARCAEYSKAGRKRFSSDSRFRLSAASAKVICWGETPGNKNSVGAIAKAQMIAAVSRPVAQIAAAQINSQSLGLFMNKEVAAASNAMPPPPKTLIVVAMRESVPIETVTLAAIINSACLSSSRWTDSHTWSHNSGAKRFISSGLLSVATVRGERNGIRIKCRSYFVLQSGQYREFTRHRQARIRKTAGLWTGVENAKQGIRAFPGSLVSREAE
jgi:hypothetical protein